MTDSTMQLITAISLRIARQAFYGGAHTVDAMQVLAVSELQPLAEVLDAAELVTNNGSHYRHVLAKALANLRALAEQGAVGEGRDDE